MRFPGPNDPKHVFQPAADNAAACRDCGFDEPHHDLMEITYRVVGASTRPHCIRCGSEEDLRAVAFPTMKETGSWLPTLDVCGPCLATWETEDYWQKHGPAQPVEPEDE